MSSKNIIGIVVVTAVVAGAYVLGTQQGNKQKEAPQAEAPKTAAELGPGAGPIPSDKAVPDSHADVANLLARASNRDLDFNHFAVGNSNVKTILADGSNMWIGTSKGVVQYDLDSNSHRIYDVRTGLLSNGIFHLSKEGDNLIVGTYGGGLSILDTKTESWENYNIQHGLGDAFVYDYLKLDNGDIWIATWSGANRIKGGRLDDRSAWETYTVANTNGGLPNDWVYGLQAGKEGDVWMATEGGLTHFTKDEKWENWQHDDGLGTPYDLVKDAIEFKNDPSKVSSHHARQKIEQGLGDVDIAYNPNYIVAILVDDDNSVWVGTWGGGLVHYDGNGNFTNYSTNEGLPANHVFMLKKDSHGQMWIGTSKGLVRKDGDTFTVFDMTDGLFAPNVFSMGEDRNGDFWVGGYGGVARISGIATAE